MREKQHIQNEKHPLLEFNNFSERIGFFLGTILLFGFFCYACLDEKQGLLYILSFGGFALLFAFIFLFGLKKVSITGEGVIVSYALSFLRKPKTLGRTKVEFRLLPKRKIGPKNGVTLRYEKKSILNKNLSRKENHLEEFFTTTSQLGYMWAIHAERKAAFDESLTSFKSKNR